ncbi:6-pyruvoyl tetrahydropterin synthase protein [Synechococcus phage Ssp-JY38]|nr:6-pyruvoyl tetrahydropterin synthase [Synechococcus phage Yong-L2-223]
MSYVVTKRLGPFSACFRNWRAETHCKFLHGHDIEFTITLEADELNEQGWVIDFGAFKPLREKLNNTFDHKVIVADDDPHRDDITALAGLGVLDAVSMVSVGCEAFAAFAAVEMANILSDRGELGRVRVASVWCYEQHNNAAGFEP